MKVICIVLAVLLVGTIVGGCLQHEAYGKASWHNGFTEGEKAGQQTGYTEGFQVGQDEGYNRGYQVGMDEWYQKGIKEAEDRLTPEVKRLKAKISRAEGLRSPTYQEVVDFLKEDRTNLNEYSVPDYTILHFAAELNNNAEAVGIRAGYARVEMKPAHKWYFVAFETTDQGLVFVEPRTDIVLTDSEIAVGKIFQQMNWKEPHEIKYILIIW